MSYRRSSPPMSRDSGSSSATRSYGSGRGDYADRRGPPPGRGYRDEYASRGSRRSRSPPQARGGYSGRDRREDRYDDRRDRDYPRDAPPPPRDDRSSRNAGPPPPRRDDNSRRRQASPPRRAERDLQEERGRSAREEAVEVGREATTNGDDNVETEDGEVQDDEEGDMMAAMGFGGFGTTKNTKVDGNQAGAAEVKKERTWRQYMQRKGGFNRPLSPVRKG